jgi:DNA helicase II / ATP-dependent DNA helicase PcrA
LPVSRFRFRPDGSLCIRSVPARFKHDADAAAALGQTDALRLKLNLARGGRVSFDDAMYWSLRVLLEHPDVASVIAARFQELLVDEAQDTSELQLACLDALCATGRLHSLVLIGDLEQSICSFTGASRVGCESLAEQRGLTAIELTENHRSSQRICDVAVHFCSREQPDRAVGEDADCPWQPELTIYPADDPARAVDAFRARLAELGHDDKDAAVLARRNDLVAELNGRTTPIAVRPRPLALGRAVSALRGAATLGRRDVEAVERIVAFTAWDTTDLGLLEPERRWGLRKATMRLLERAPELELDLRTWIRNAATALTDAAGTLASTPAHAAGHVLQSASGHEAHVAGSIFVPPAPTLSAQTVHDIKGESRGAVLVVVQPRRASRQGSQSALWSRPLIGGAVSAEEAEELRIAFVALTRARRFCMLALPGDSGDDVVDAFCSAGFHLP